MTYVLVYTWPLMQRATAAYLWRVTGWRFTLAVGLLVVAAVGMVVRGDRSWMLGLFAAGVVIGVLVPLALFVQERRRGLQMLRDAQRSPLTLTLSPASFALSSSAVGAAELPWSRVKDLWQYPDFWFLVLEPPRFVTLPTASLDAAGLALIEEQVRAAGGRVRRRGRRPAEHA